MITDTRKSSSILLLGAALAAVTSALTGCSQQAFVVTNTIQEQKAPGTFMVPAKVDILLAQDDSGSMKEVYEKIAEQMPVFLNGLEGKRWDYHFATIPLAGTRPLDQVTASRHDSNYGSLWIAPYPGATADGAGTLASWLFRPLSQYTGFLSKDDLSSSTNGSEPGLQNIYSTLYGAAAREGGFLRPDAMLVVLAVGNGEDTSGIQYCNRGDGYMVACAGSKESSFANYKGALLNLKPGNPGMVRFYSAVSPSLQCFGRDAYVGNRYMEMATALGGETYDVCSQPVSSILASLDNHLTNTQIQFRTRYLFIEREPNMDTVVVTKYANGDLNQSSIIPQDTENGWTYAGWVDNAATIDWPSEMNRASGYAIELHGSAKLVGDDRATVTFKPVGAVDAVTPR
ncbi:MAG: hypothetical protein A2X94_16140 [Bdellovibrionales bacterium GWB1_55_8]|nr:MAG: hypothetical protein A2X94_16140 [Bdellovibrionales bacterium GWB1_55_8]